MKDTQQILELATLAAESAIKKEGKEVYRRINELVDRLSESANEIAKLSVLVGGSDDRAKAIIREEIKACVMSRKKDGRASVSLVVSVCAVTISFGKSFTDWVLSLL